MSARISDYQLKQRKGLNPWAPILEEWLVCTERYSRVLKGEDAPFLYTERACIGTLAAAAWRAGFISLEEFQYDKTNDVGEARTGRCDLFIGNEKVEYYAEAKFKRLSLGATTSVHDRVVDCIEEASLDVKRLSLDGGGPTKISLAFMPCYLMGSQADRLEPRINELVDEAKPLPWHFFAWCFPKEMRSFVSENENFNPGILMFGRNVDV